MGLENQFSTLPQDAGQIKLRRHQKNFARRQQEGHIREEINRQRLTVGKYVTLEYQMNGQLRKVEGFLVLDEGARIQLNTTKKIRLRNIMSVSVRK